MNSRIIILITVILVSFSGYLFAHEGMHHDDQEVGNKICPVSSDKIPVPGQKGSMGETAKYEYKGKIYNLCCKMCAKDFKKDSEKYSKIAEEEVAKEKGMQEEHQEGQEDHAGHDHK